MARSLRKQRRFTIGVMVPDVSGPEDQLLQEGYFYFVASHRPQPDLIEEYAKLLLERSVEGLIAVDSRESINIRSSCHKWEDRSN